jgi:hypothetical protein
VESSVYHLIQLAILDKSVLITRDTRSKKAIANIDLNEKSLTFSIVKIPFCGSTSTGQIKFNDFCNSTNKAFDPQRKIMTSIVDPYTVDFDSVDLIRI